MIRRSDYGETIEPSFDYDCPAYLCITGPRYTSITINEGSEEIDDCATARELSNDLGRQWNIIKACIDTAGDIPTAMLGCKKVYDFDMVAAAVEKYGPPIDAIRENKISLTGWTINKYNLATNGAIQPVCVLQGIRFFSRLDIEVMKDWVYENRKAKRDSQRRQNAEYHEALRLVGLAKRNAKKEARALISRMQAMGNISRANLSAELGVTREAIKRYVKSVKIKEMGTYQYGPIFYEPDDAATIREHFKQ
jgi:hypothetical protein